MKALKRFITITWLLLGCASFAANEQDVIASVEYFYAPDGTLTGRAINGIRQNFEYDKRGQLLAVKDANGRDLERYTYDPAGNRLSKTLNGVTTTYTYDEANQLKTSTVNGETTRYRYDAAGRLVQAGDKTYYYFGANDKVTEVRQGDKVIAEFDYFMDGQIASAKYPDREERFTWDGLALVQRNEVSYLNEPYVTGGNPILSSRDGVMFNDMLGSTLNIGGQPVSMTSFGETEDTASFFTGKPLIPELGYSFLFRDYNPSQGKWTSSDPLGYPDGWNNLAYCNNIAINSIDWLGKEKVTITSLYDALNHYAFGFGFEATIGQNIILQSTSTAGFASEMSAVKNLLSSQPKTDNKGFLSYNGSFRWDQGDVLGRNTMTFYTSFTWVAGKWEKEGNRYVRTLSGTGNIFLHTEDFWNFETHKKDKLWENLKREVLPGIAAHLYSRLVTGVKGDNFPLSGSAIIRNFNFMVKQYE